MLIVVYDDGSMCCPYGWSTDCEGAIESTSGDVAVFETRAEARQAIRISTRFAKLCEAQGKPVNTDFTQYAKNIKVRKLKARAT